MKLKDIFGKKTKVNSEKISIKIDKNQLAKLTGGLSELETPIPEKQVPWLKQKS
jgi:hypothetical protein